MARNLPHSVSFCQAGGFDREELGKLGLTEREIDDLTAFLLTLTDGYRPEKGAAN